MVNAPDVRRGPALQRLPCPHSLARSRLLVGPPRAPRSTAANLTVTRVNGSVVVSSLGSPVGTVVAADIPIGIGPRSYGAQPLVRAPPPA
jgi:hypothetical protein